MKENSDSRILENIFVVDSVNVYEDKLVQQCFDIVGVFVAAVDLQGNISLINKKGKELLGYAEKEIIGANFIEKFVANPDKQKTKEFLSSIMEEQLNYAENIKYHLLTQNNKIKVIETKNTTIRDRNNTILGVLISGEDVTGYVKYQNELKKDINLYRILANNIPDINLFLFNKDLKFILAEGSEMKNNNFSRNYFEGKKLSEISDNKIKELWEPLFLAAINGKESSTEYQFNNYYYLIWVVPVKKGDDKSYTGVAITQNITDDKLNELKLKKSKEEAEKANNAKSDFLARVSHEIRTPLNAILGFTEQLIQTSLTKQQEEYLKIIDKSSEHLLSLINDILVLSKIEARRINFENSPFKISSTIKYVHKALVAKADEKDLQFTYTIDQKLDRIVVGDSFRLRQILMNIISNAIKFTNTGYVEIKSFLAEENKEEIKIRFDIIDTGIGINPHQLESIFEQFKQADAEITKKYGGTGLGLTICKNLIEMQNGSLSVSSQENIGSTFTFIVPYKKGKKTDLVADSFGKIDSEKLRDKKVLLVDDDSINRLLGKTILEKFNCDYDIASNGKSAIDKLKLNAYEIVLLDIHMPDINGIDVAKHIRTKNKDNSTKIVAVTAAVMKGDIKKYLQAGINDFLIKPFKEIHLFNKICEVLRIKGQPYKQSKEQIILKEEVSPRTFDLSELKTMLGNNRSAINKMLTTFIENSENAIESFEKSLKTKNWKQIGETAHKLLPSYKHIRANSISRDLLQLKNTTLFEPNYKAVPALLERILNNMKELLKKLKEEVS